jgi:hypothetical protein
MANLTVCFLANQKPSIFLAANQCMCIYIYENAIDVKNMNILNYPSRADPGMRSRVQGGIANSLYIFQTSKFIVSYTLLLSRWHVGSPLLHQAHSVNWNLLAVCLRSCIDGLWTVQTFIDVQKQASRRITRWA